jgi:Flp pilus assembly protein TadG
MIFKNKVIKSERGQALVELAFCLIILILFFYAFFETVYLIRDVVYVNRIAREGAREATLTGSLGAGKAKAEDCTLQYFSSINGTVIILDTSSSSGSIDNVICTVSHEHRPFEKLTEKGIGRVVNLNAEAVYPWWDENT